MSVKKLENNLVRLGNYIEEVLLKVGENNQIEISGINLEKGFIPTVADMNGIDKSKYKLVPSNCFACNLMHIGRDVKIPIAYNISDETIAVSPAYYIFKIKENKKNNILGYYLEMLLTRNEFGRLAWFHTDSSIRGNLLISELNEILIPLPDLYIQQELVDTYNGLKALAEQNEALIKPLTEACQAYIIDCKKQYSEVELGDYLDFFHEKNTDCKITLEQGINIDKVFINPHRPNSDLSSRIIVRKGQFAYCTQLNNENVAIAYRKGDDCVVSTVYNAFEIKQQYKNMLFPEYLFMWLKRKEFGRFVYWRSIGSAYEFLREENIREYKIPLPPPEVQQAIVDIYNCAEEAKKIANDAREKIKNLCPALVQRALNG